MTTKDFDAMLAATAGVRPQFKVAGETFTARARIPYKRFQTVLALMRDDVTSEEDATNGFFSAAIIRADRERFFTLLNFCDEDADEERDDDRVIGQEALNEIVQWLLGIYTGKAKSNDPPSSAGSPTTGGSPNVVSLNSRTAAV